MNRILRIGPKTFLQRVSPGLFASLRHQRIRVLRDATQLWYNFHNCHSILVVAFSSLLGKVAFLWLFCVVVHQPYDAGTNICPRLYIPIRFFIEMTFGRMPLLPRILLFLDTLRPRDTVSSEVVAALCSGFCARSFHAGNCIGLLSNTGLFLSTGNKYFFLLQRHSIPFDS